MTNKTITLSILALLVFALDIAAEERETFVPFDGKAVLSKLPADKLEMLRNSRKESVAAKKRLIFDNDGCDALHFPKTMEGTVQNFLDRRTTELLGSDVTTLSYCTISSGFGLFTHDTKAGEFLSRDIGPINPNSKNIASELRRQGRDVLQIVADFCKENRLECFWTFRMNDTHDAATKPDNVYPLFPKLKQEHPELMVGSFQKKTPFGTWTSVDFAKVRIRDLAFRYTEEVCQGYEIDGIVLDFCRHLCFFASVANGGTASTEELEMMTDLLRRIRVMTEVEGVRRGRPILVSVRVPDGPGYAKAIGLDVETWMKEDLADIYIGSDYFQLAPWSDWVALGKKHGAAVYAGISESRVRNTDRFKRGGVEAYRARCAEAWKAGVDGVYIFNVYDAQAPFLRDVGSLKNLEAKDKLYFATTRIDGGYPINFYLRDGSRFLKMPLLVPNAPWEIDDSESRSLEMDFADDIPKDNSLKITLHCWFGKPIEPENFMVTLNATPLKKGVSARNGWMDIPVPTDLPKVGRNQWMFRTAKGATILKDIVVQYDFAPFEQR